MGAAARRRAPWLVCLVTAFVLGSLPAAAEKLPIRTFTALDGLADDGIRDIYADSQGFVWFCTREGLSRFDGRAFATFGTAEGLPDASAHTLVEREEGLFLVATGAGLVTFDARATSDRFEPFGVGGPETGVVHAMTRARDGSIWLGGERGVFVLPAGGALERAPLEFVEPPSGGYSLVEGLVEDQQGNIWVAHSTGLYRLDRKGHSLRLGAAEGLPTDQVRALAVDDEGRIWVGTTRGLALVETEDAAAPTQVRPTALDVVPEHAWINQLMPLPDGGLWAATERGLFVIESGEATWKVRALTESEGLASASVTALASTRGGDVWIGTTSSGAMRLSASGFSSFGSEEGLTETRIASLVIAQENTLCALPSDTAHQRLYCLRDGRFSRIELREPLRSLERTWGWNQISFQDSAGAWWFATGSGLVRYAPAADPWGLARARPHAVYTRKEGLPSDYVFRLYEDRSGDIWVGLAANQPPNLLRWERATESFESFEPQEGLPFSTPTAFAEDDQGQLWIGLYGGGVVRRREGRFELFSGDEGCPENTIRALYVDHGGRLWIATEGGGLARVHSPGAESPSFELMSRESGLSSDLVTCFAEDDQGRLYVGTSRGVDRIEPGTNRVTHLGRADGLPNSYVNVARRHPDGSLWFGTLDGVARLMPEETGNGPPPAALIAGIRVEGKEIPLPAIGQREVTLPSLPPGVGPIEIAFLAPGEDPLYRYRVAGSRAGWSEATSQRSVHVAGLRSGEHVFEVIAVGRDGLMSSEPARVRIEILPPIWGRAWFVALTLAAFVLSVFAAHRIRVASLRHRTLQLTRTVTERTAELERARAKLEEANQGLEQRVKEGIEALRESERMAAYGHLIAKVAHEVRHPIFSLQASAYVLADKLRNKDGFDKQLRVLERETGRMSTLMNDLLDFARPAELSLDETEPSSLLSEAIESFCSAPNADETPDIRVEVAEGLPGVMLDRTRMLEVFVNLMENARRHAQGATLLSLRACQGEGTLRFVIEDDGVGIPEDKLPHVFEPFYTGGNGTGLGLAIVRRIVLDHGGTIRVESKPGEGSAFVIDLPTREPSEQGS